MDMIPRVNHTGARRSPLQFVLFRNLARGKDTVRVSYGQSSQFDRVFKHTHRNLQSIHFFIVEQALLSADCRHNVLLTFESYMLIISTQHHIHRPLAVYCRTCGAGFLAQGMRNYCRLHYMIQSGSSLMMTLFAIYTKKHSLL